MNKRVCSTSTGRPEGRRRKVLAPGVKTTLMEEHARFFTRIEDRGSGIEVRSDLPQSLMLDPDFSKMDLSDRGARVSRGVNPRSSIPDPRSCERSEL